VLFRETVAVYCENHMEHITTLWGRGGEEIEKKKESWELV
jgi:hypothetical protein